MTIAHVRYMYTLTIWNKPCASLVIFSAITNPLAGGCGGTADISFALSVSSDAAAAMYTKQWEKSHKKLDMTNIWSARTNTHTDTIKTNLTQIPLSTAVNNRCPTLSFFWAIVCLLVYYLMAYQHYLAISAKKWWMKTYKTCINGRKLSESKTAPGNQINFMPQS